MPSLPHFNPSPLEAILYLILVVPTIWVMLTGAPFVPTPMAQVRRMLNAVPIKKGQKIADLGSGDGRLVHEASIRYGAQGFGFEFSPLIYLWSKFIQPWFWSKGSHAKIIFSNFWSQDLSDMDIIVCYLLTPAMEKMKTKIIPGLKPGAFIVSHAFPIEGLKAYKHIPRSKEEKLGPIWVYQVPKANSHKAKGPARPSKKSARI